MSSRNVYLTDEERKEAQHLYQALKRGKEWLKDYDSGETEQKMIKYLEEQTSGNVEYCKILTYPELLPPKMNDNKRIMAVSVRFTNARLIDNVIFDNITNTQGSEETTCSVH